MHTPAADGKVGTRVRAAGRALIGSSIVLSRPCSLATVIDDLILYTHVQVEMTLHIYTKALVLAIYALCQSNNM